MPDSQPFDLYEVLHRDARFSGSLCYALEKSINSDKANRNNRKAFKRDQGLESISPLLWGKDPQTNQGTHNWHRRAWLLTQWVRLYGLPSSGRIGWRIRSGYDKAGGAVAAPPGRWTDNSRQEARGEGAQPETPRKESPIPAPESPPVPPTPTPEPEVPAEEPQKAPEAPVTAQAPKGGLEAVWESLGITQAVQEALGASLPGVIEAVKAQVQVHRVEVKDPRGVVKEVPGITHRVMAEVLEFVSAGHYVWLFGPAGTGKSHMPIQISEALGLRYLPISCARGMSKAEFHGMLLPTGDGGKFEHHEAAFIDFVVNGGLVAVEEVANMPADMATMLNNLLSQGEAYIQIRLDDPHVKIHPDFRLIVLDNTNGTGGGRKYVRQQQDFSFIDRFRQVFVGYDKDMERALCPDEPLLKGFWGLREKAERGGVNREVGFRSIQRSYKDRVLFGKDSYPVERCLRLETGGWTDDELAKVGMQRSA